MTCLQMVNAASGTTADFLKLSRAVYWNPTIITRFLNFALPAVHPPVILELGSGTGYFTAHLAQFCPQARILGLELNAHSLVVADKSLPPAGLGSQVLLIQGNCQALPLPAASLDLILTHFFFIDSPEPELSLQEAVTTLKPGGILAVMEPIYQTDLLNCYYPGLSDSEQELLSTVYRKVLLADIKARGIDRGITPKLPYLISKLGLTDLQIEVAIDYYLSLTLPNERLGLLRSLAAGAGAENPTIRSEPNNPQTMGTLTQAELDFVAGIQDRYRALIARDPESYKNSGFFTTMSFLFLKGKKSA